MAQKPVIFLAYANDKTEQGVYLRNLTVEMHGIREVLNQAAKNGLCEIVERSSATISDIVSVFQDPAYNSRIAIFHYAGHADGNALLLESLDGSQSIAHKEGLVDLLSRQDGLKLVFFNGCSSEGQTDALLNAGVPAVIGTTSAINDNIATQLSIRFYNGIGLGSGIEKSWLDALSEVKITVGDENTRGLNWAGKTESTGLFPWIIKFRNGANIVRKWNLPDTAGNPLFGLPEPPPINLPESPFVYINKYERKHADVFFGRSKYIRDLYFQATDPNAPPVILLYGQSGVGKSSLLEAGLAPRLEAKYEVVLIRRNDFLGLSKTLYQTLLHKCGFEDTDITIEEPQKARQNSMVNSLELINRDLNSEAIKPDIERIIIKIKEKYAPITATPEDEPVPDNLAEAWKLTESLFKKPLVVIYDQLEEAFTRPNPKIKNEISDLFNDLKLVFSNAANQPRGKIILCYAKAYQPEIEEYCNTTEISRSRIFLDNLVKEDILEIFSELTTNQKLKFAYNLVIEENLAELVATDYTRSRNESTVGPVLQILLTKMWNKAQGLNKGNPVFSNDLYKDLKEDGVAMGEFLQNQLDTLGTQVPDAYSSGFVTDLLFFHCTKNNTSGLCTEKDILTRYPYSHDIVGQTLECCKNLLLLVNASGVENATILAHDSLALEIINLEKKSTRPVQQAGRILDAKIDMINSGAKRSVLDEYDLKIIKSATPFMRAITQEESKLISYSTIELEKEKRSKRKLAIAKMAVGIIILIGSIIVSAFFIKSKIDEKNIYMGLRAAKSSLYLNNDNTLSLFYAADGFAKGGSRYSSPEIKRALTTAFYAVVDSNTPLYKSYLDGESPFINILYDPTGKFFIPLPQDSAATIYNFDGMPIATLKGNVRANYSKPFLLLANAALLSNKLYIAGLGSDSVLRVWDTSGKNIFETDPKKRIISFDCSPITNQFLIVYKNTIEIHNIFGKVIRKLIVHEPAKKVMFSPDAGELLVFMRSGSLMLMDLSSDTYKPLNYAPGKIHAAVFSHKGDLILTSYSDSVFVLWDSSGNKLKTFPKQASEIQSFEFHPSDSIFVVCSGRNADLYYVRDYHMERTIAQNDFITFADFSPDGNRMLTGSSDNTAVIWSLTGARKKILLGHVNDVTSGFFSNDGKKVFTASLDGTVKSWDLNIYQTPVLSGHRGPVTYIKLDSDSKHLCSAGKDSTLCVWQISDSVNKLVARHKFKRDIYDPVFSKDGSKILGTTSGNKVFLWNWESNMFVFTAFDVNNMIGAGFWGNDSIVTVSTDSLRFWDFSGKCFEAISVKDNDTFSCLNIAKNKKEIAVGGRSGFTYLYDSTGKFSERVGENKPGMGVMSCDLSPDGSKLLITGKDNVAVIFDLEKKSHIVFNKSVEAPYYKFRINEARFSKNGDLVVTASSDRAARVWNLNGTLKGTLYGHSDNVTDAKFTPDYKVFTISDDRTVRYWLPDGTEIEQYSYRNLHINDVVIDKTGDRLFAAFDDGTIRIWLTAKGIYNWVSSNPAYIYHRKNTDLTD